MTMSRSIGFRGLLSKMQRALRNGTGCTLSYDEVVLLLHLPVWPALIAAEAEELRAAHPLTEDQADD